VWTVGVESGSYAVVEVRHRGVDLLIRLLGPEGRQRRSIDRVLEVDGTERASWIADRTGDWSLVVAPYEESPDGGYEIEWTVHRPPTLSDRQRVEADSMGELANAALFEEENPAEGVRLFERAVALNDSAVGPVHAALAGSLHGLAFAYGRVGRYADATPLLERALSILEEVDPDNRAEIALRLNNLAANYGNLGRLPEAIATMERAVAIREVTIGAEHPDLGVSLNGLAVVYGRAGRYSEAEATYQRALSIFETAHGPTHDRVASTLTSLGTLYTRQGRFEEAEPLLQRSLEIRESLFGPDDPRLAPSLGNLGNMYSSVGRIREAIGLAERALSLVESALPADHPNVALRLSNLAALYDLLGSYDEAAPLHRRALAIRESRLGPDHQDVAMSLNNLASLLLRSGRLAQAEPLYRRAIEILENRIGRDHIDFARALSNLASLYDRQGRPEEAEPIRLEIRRILDDSVVRDHPTRLAALNNLATSYGMDRFEEAESIYLEVLAAAREADPPRVDQLGFTLRNLADLYGQRGDLEKAIPLLEEALAIREREFGEDFPGVAEVLKDLAALRLVTGQPEAALAGVDRALAILEHTGAHPDWVIDGLSVRANIHKVRGDDAAAISDLADALRRIEIARPLVGGSAQGRAAFFGAYALRFDLMVGWQIEAGNVAEAFAFAERGRARALLDQLAAGNVDLRASVPPEQRERLEAQERAARSRLAEYQQRITLLRGRHDLDEAARRARLASLEDSLRLADLAFRGVDAEIKSASGLLQTLTGESPVSLAEAQERLVPDGGMLLFYDIGEQSSRLFAVPPAGGETRVLALRIDEEAAALLDLDPGPLTSVSLNRALMGDSAADSSRGVAGLASRGTRSLRRGISPEQTLHGLWRLLVPEELWSRVRSMPEVIVIPDGALHQLPFEALVVEPGSESGKVRYWLDGGPAIRYATSATSLTRLGDRGPSEAVNILSLSDPIYDPSEVEAVAVDPAPSEHPRRAEYERAGGRLARLPGTAEETRALVEALAGGTPSRDVTVLQRVQASETRLRDALADKRYVHLATHGLVDETRSSLFAALALTPPVGETSDSEDDGFLQLFEIYDLDLADVELTVLSACQTNVGEAVEGEGVFALSRGFLAAGSRRVIASQWSVDDASTAAMIGEFFRILAEAEGAGRSMDFAAALRDAKRFVRGQDRWSDPYFWAPFILTGQR
jgi:tetratricopeptide (TPR) repeat protein/CHAT domain-containing protein